MKNVRGFLVGGIFVVLTWLLTVAAKHFRDLLNMVYPYFSRTVQAFLAQLTSGTSACVWQILVILLLAALVLTIALMILLRWNFFEWLGWVCASAAMLVFLYVGFWGLNYYDSSLSDSLRLTVKDYTVSNLEDAAVYYRDQANALSGKVPRDETGALDFGTFDELADQAANGFANMTLQYSVFAGSQLPVKELGWKNLYTRMGIDGITVAFTGEACVNPDTFTGLLPFTMCHEMSHRMSLATENDANFAAYLTCQANEDIRFQYSGYYSAYVYCYNALAGLDSAAAARVRAGVTDELAADLEAHSEHVRETEGPVRDTASKVNDSYLKSFEQEDGIKSYDRVSDMLVNWYLQVYTAPEEPEEPAFDPYHVELP